MLWHTKYETGNEQVDNEHKEIFKLAQKVIDAAFENKEEEIETTVNFLANYTVSHFKHEEQLMKESAYPEKDIHKKQHSDFVQDVTALIERVVNEPDSKKNSVDINNVIVNWLTEHVLGSDKLMATHYREWSASRVS